MASHEPAPRYASEKNPGEVEVEKGVISTSSDPYATDQIINDASPLRRGLHGRHMQMIAIGERV
jgi:amino acid permease